MGMRAGPCGRGVGSLSYSGPCENGGSECKAKFFCKPSAKPWGEKQAPDTGPSAAAVAAAFLASPASASRSEPPRRRPAEGRPARKAFRCLEPSQRGPAYRPPPPPTSSCFGSGSRSPGSGNRGSSTPPLHCRCGAAGAEPGLRLGSKDRRLRSCKLPARQDAHRRGGSAA